MISIVTAANTKIAFCIDNTTDIPFDIVRSWKKLIETQSKKYNIDVSFVSLINISKEIRNCDIFVLIIQNPEDINQFTDFKKLTESQTIKQLLYSFKKVHLIQLVDKPFSYDKKQFLDNHFYYYVIHIDHDIDYFKSIIKWIISHSLDNIHVTIQMHSKLFTSENDIALIRKRLIHDAPVNINQDPMIKMSIVVEKIDKKLTFARNDFGRKNYFKQIYLLHIEKNTSGPFAHFHFLSADLNRMNQFLIHPGRCQYFVPYHNMMDLADETMKIIDRLKKYYQIDFLNK